MDAVEGAIVDKGDEGADLSRQVLVGGRHEARIRGRRAMRAMGVRGPRDLLGVRGGVRRTPTAVAMHVDEARQDGAAVELDVNDHGVVESHARDDRAIDADPPALEFAVSIEEQRATQRHGHVPNLRRRRRG